MQTVILNNDIVLTLTTGDTIPAVEVYHNRLQMVIIVMHYNLTHPVVMRVVLGFNYKAHNALTNKFKYYTRDVSAIGDHLSVFLAKYVLCTAHVQNTLSHVQFPSLRQNSDITIRFSDLDFHYAGMMKDCIFSSRH